MYQLNIWLQTELTLILSTARWNNDDVWRIGEF